MTSSSSVAGATPITPGERANRNRDVVVERHVGLAFFKAERLQLGVGKLVGQETETGSDARPTPIQNFDLMERHREYITRFGGFHVDRPCEGMDRIEIHVRHRVDSGIERELTVGRLLRFDFDDSAGGDRQDGRDRTAPAVVGVLSAQRVLDLHRGHRGHRGRRGLGGRRRFGCCAGSQSQREWDDDGPSGSRSARFHGQSPLNLDLSETIPLVSRANCNCRSYMDAAILIRQWNTFRCSRSRLGTAHERQ